MESEWSEMSISEKAPGRKRTQAIAAALTACLAAGVSRAAEAPTAPGAAPAAVAPAPSVAAPPATTKGKTLQECRDCPVMVTLPDGAALGKYPVTRGQFAVFAKDTGLRTKGCYQSQRNGTDWTKGETADWRAPGFPQTDGHPVVCVSWTEATAYADWLTKKTGHLYRLPTLEESVAAAQAGGSDEFWWGKAAADICQYANVADDSYAKTYPDDKRTRPACKDGFAYTAPVGSFKPNAYGLYDMSGNVWQWTNSCFKGDCSNGTFRGGAWNDADIENFRMKHSWGDRAAVRSFALGFRVLRSGS